MMARRDLAFRSRMVQAMLTPALVLRPLPEEVADRIASFVRELSVDEAMIDIARKFSPAPSAWPRSTSSATATRPNGRPEDAARAPHVDRARSRRGTSAVPGPRARCPLGGARGPAGGHARPAGLGDVPGASASCSPVSPAPRRRCSPSTTGCTSWRTTAPPSSPSWRCSPSSSRRQRRHAGVLAAGHGVSLFETGYLRTGAGLFQSDTGHISPNRGHGDSASADAHPAGRARCRDVVKRASDSIDYLRLDWFALADLPVADGCARFNVTPKSDDAIAAGSVGPWQPGGISPFQERAWPASRRGVITDGSRHTARRGAPTSRPARSRPGSSAGARGPTR